MVVQGTSRTFVVFDVSATGLVFKIPYIYPLDAIVVNG
jgi:hypothetical protein